VHLELHLQFDLALGSIEADRLGLHSVSVAGSKLSHTLRSV
jgi:hypothetical protein